MDRETKPEWTSEKSAWEILCNQEKQLIKKFKDKNEKT